MCLSICAGIIISIHTPTRGVTYNRYIEQEGAEDFNPHSHKGSDNSFHAEFSAKLHFNPHSHKGSDNHITTNDNRRVDFNPHSHKGSDRLLLHKSLYVCNFNPHSHKGSDMGNEIFGYKVDISIHTPTRGVTGTGTGTDTDKDISIHTPTRGVTQRQV